MIAMIAACGGSQRIAAAEPDPEPGFSEYLRYHNSTKFIQMQAL
jgi:hypothetical protein